MRRFLNVVALLVVLGITHSASGMTAWMAEKQIVNAPSGYQDLCVRQMDICSGSDDRSTMATLSTGAYRQLSIFNKKVNLTIPYNPDMQRFGRSDYWEIAIESGDCEDIALAKRAALIAAGWPANALWLAIGLAPGGQSHVVLVIRSNRGDLVLDNRTNEILLWHESQMRFLARQVPGDTRNWRRLETHL